MEAELASERAHKEALAGELAGMRAEMGALRDALGDLRSGTDERDAKVLPKRAAVRACWSRSRPALSRRGVARDRRCSG